MHEGDMVRFYCTKDRNQGRGRWCPVGWIFGQVVAVKPAKGERIEFADVRFRDGDVRNVPSFQLERV